MSSTRESRAAFEAGQMGVDWSDEVLDSVKALNKIDVALLAKAAGKVAIGFEVALGAVEVIAVYNQEGLAAAALAGDRLAVQAAASTGVGYLTREAMSQIRPSMPPQARVITALAAAAASTPFIGHLFDFGSCEVGNLAPAGLGPYDRQVVYDYYNPNGLITFETGYCFAYTLPASAYGGGFS
ncbi:MAG: hypothetical protein GY788_10120 [bacterium]|nr:hypothetical protein [bacterium]